MDKEMRQKWHRAVVEGLFADDYSDIFGKIGKVIGLTDEEDFDEVICSLEDRIRTMVKSDEAPSYSEAIYEKLGPDEIMLVEKVGGKMLILRNENGHPHFGAYDMGDLEEQAIIMPGYAADFLVQLNSIREDLDKLLKAQPEKVDLLDDHHAEMDGVYEELPDDVESLDEPRIHGEE